MIIKTLVDNNSISENFKSEHGLSVYIETKGLKILFDTGASPLFLENANKLGVDISGIDILIISHGHYDHGGGIQTFLSKNQKAKVYIHLLAFEEYYSLRQNDNLEYIGLCKSLKGNNQIIFTEKKYNINNNIEIFSNVLQKAPLPISNQTLFKKEKNQIILDTFEHEQNLVIKENDKTLLLVGCAHNGIINILSHFNSLYGYMPDYVIGGFHLSSKTSGDESQESIENLAKYLLTTGATFYTGHCTGLGPYKILKTIMKDKVNYISAGSILKLN